MKRTARDKQKYIFFKGSPMIHIWTLSSYLDGVRLSWNVNAVSHDADLAEKRQFVVRQETVGLVKKKVAPDEFLEAPIFTLKKRNVNLFTDLLNNGYWGTPIDWILQLSPKRWTVLNKYCDPQKQVKFAPL